METRTTSSKLRGGVRRTAWIAATLAGLTLIASPALADPPLGAGSGAGAGTTTPPAGTPTGGGGGTGTQTYTYYSYISAAQYSLVQCAATDSRGEALEGRRIRFRGPGTLTIDQLKTIAMSGDASGNNQWAANGVEKLSDVCLYPPAYEIRTTQAVISSTATVEMVTPESKTLGSPVTDTSSWGRGDHSMAALTSSRTFAAVAATPTELGRYQASAITMMQSVSVKHYLGADPITGATTPDSIVSIGAPYRAYPAGSRGELTCSGWHDGWSTNMDWTEAPCSGSTAGQPVTYQCTAPSLPSMDGELLTDQRFPGLAAGAMNVFHDGKTRRIDWTMPSFSAPSLVSIDHTASRVTRSGTPNRNYEIEVGPRDGDDTLTSDKSATAWIDGSVGQWDARFRWASTAGLPTVLTPQVEWETTMMKSSVEITGVNENGVWTTHTVQTPVHTSLSCSGYPVSVNVVRAVNS